jgi:ethanolamine ammonia-lyase small subunit
VGIVDHIGEILKPKAALILLGERPGLATPESLGAYFTFKPHAGLTDADRNCISNIHSSGMEPDQAAHQLHFLLMESLRTSLGGVALSEFMGTHPDKPELE